MRNLKKFLAVLVVVAMLASSMMTVFGAADPALSPAEKAVGLGLLKGGSDGVTDEYLSLSTQRIQTAQIYLRLLGKEAEALAYTATTDNFADADLVKDAPGAVNLLAYLKANPQLGWVGDGTNFNPLGTVSGKALYKVMLTSVGYTQGMDFDYDDTIGFARAKGFALAGFVGASDEVSNNNMAAAMIEALGTTVNGKAYTLAQQLVDTKVITAAAADKYTSYVAPTATPTVAPNDLKITSIKSDNLKSVVVTFNAPVDATKGADKANYTAKVGTTDKGVANVTLAADKLSATLLLTTAIAQLDKVTVTYAKAAVSSTATADVTATSDAISDVTMPTVKDVAVTGNKFLKITYSEPVNADAAKYLGNYTIDGSVYSANQPTLSDDGLVVSINMTQRMAAGVHKVAVKTPDVKDYAALPIAPNSKDITVAEDKVAPAKATVVSATQNKVVAQFDKALDTIDSTVKAGDKTGTAAIDTSDRTKVNVTFAAGNYLPASPSTLVFTNAMDLSGNILTTYSLTVTPEVDVIRPTYVGYAQDAGNIVVEFSEDMVLGAASNFTLKDKDGNIMPLGTPVKVTVNGTDNLKKMSIPAAVDANGIADKAPFTLAISGVTDASVQANKIVDYTVTGMTFADKTAPALAAGTIKYTAIDADHPNAKIYVVFTEKVDATTATTAANYTLISTGTNVASALPADTTLSVAGDGKTVVITFPTSYATVANVGYVNVVGVKDLALNAMTTADSRATAPASAAAPTISAVYQTGANTLVASVATNDLISGTVFPYEFFVSNGTDTIAVTNAVYEKAAAPAGYDTGNGKITFTTSQAIKANGTYGSVPTKVRLYTADSYQTASPNGVKLAPNYKGYANGIPVTDRCQATATLGAAYQNGTATTNILVNVDEQLATLAGPTNNTNVNGQVTINIGGTARAFTVTQTGPSQLLFTVNTINATADTNKAYTITYSPLPSSTLFVDMAGAAANDDNTNTLKAFTFTGNIAP